MNKIEEISRLNKVWSLQQQFIDEVSETGRLNPVSILSFLYFMTINEIREFIEFCKNNELPKLKEVLYVCDFVLENNGGE